MLCEGCQSDFIWHHRYWCVCVCGCLVVCVRERATQTEASCISSASKSVQWCIDSHIQQNKNDTAHGWMYTHWFTLKTPCTENDVNIIITWWLSNESGIKLLTREEERSVGVIPGFSNSRFIFFFLSLWLLHGVVVGDLWCWATWARGISLFCWRGPRGIETGSLTGI